MISHLGLALAFIGLSCVVMIDAACPVCAPLRLGTEAELPAFIKNKGLKMACGNVVQMNSSCVAEITCFGTNPEPSSETTLYYAEQNSWGGPGISGTRTLTQNLVCTPQGWAEYRFNDVIRANNVYYCVATPPAGASSHDCSGPIIPKTTTKGPSTPSTPTTTSGITTPTLAPGTCPPCAPFQFATEVPEDLKSLYLSVNNNKTACGYVSPMNTNCMVQISCASSNLADKRSSMYYKARNEPKWYGISTEKAVTYEFICTANGWARAKYPSAPWKTVVCMADLPSGQQTHTCSAPPPPPPTTLPKPIKCPVDWYFYEPTDSCYTTIFNCSFDNCENQCQSMGSHLASIHSKLENRFVNDMAGFGFPLPNSRATIGAKAFNGVWTWTDGTEFDYANWQDGRPVYGDTCGVTWADIPLYLTEDVVEYRYWEDISCGQITPTAVCKKPAFQN